MSANVQAKLLRALEERRIERLGGNGPFPLTCASLAPRIVRSNRKSPRVTSCRPLLPAARRYDRNTSFADRREDIPILADKFTRAAANTELPSGPWVRALCAGS